MVKNFHVCTIVNNRLLYESMRASFAEAGFNETNSSFTFLDNTSGNQHEPYGAFNKIADERHEPYLVFCHQDVLLNQGHGHERLVAVLEELSSKDPRWLVAGNAGIDFNYQQVARIVDPWRSPYWKGALPQRVLGLDENFLVIRNGSKVRWSAALAGFHFYGPDICLNATQKGRTCYVIDFQLEHLSAGSLNTIFWEIKESFHRCWNEKFHLAFVLSPTGVMMPLSKYAWLRRFMAWQPIYRRLKRPKVKRVLGWLSLAP